MTNELKHVGVLGMHWGQRKSENVSSERKLNYETDSFTLKKGTQLHRLSSVANETHKGSGYASFLESDAKSYREMGKMFSKCGMTQFDMTMKVKKIWFLHLKENELTSF
jgi:hypothetical protein